MSIVNSTICNSTILNGCVGRGVKTRRRGCWYCVSDRGGVHAVPAAQTGTALLWSASPLLPLDLPPPCFAFCLLPGRTLLSWQKGNSCRCPCPFFMLLLFCLHLTLLLLPPLPFHLHLLMALLLPFHLLLPVVLALFCLPLPFPSCPCLLVFEVTIPNPQYPPCASLHATGHRQV